MTDRDALALLAERLEEAEGPDRELDAMLVGWERSWPVDRVWWDQPYAGCHFPGTEHPQQFMDRTDKVPAYTASLDAALALVERVLPGTLTAVSDLPPNNPAGRHMAGLLGPDLDVDGYGASRSLAILSALITALLQQDVSHG